MQKPSEHNSFVLYCDQNELWGKLTNEQAGILIKNIYSYCCHDRVIPMISDPLIDMVFTAIRTSIDRDHKLWMARVEANRENGKMGGRPPKNPK